jgi:hypothetical protein
MSVWKQGDTQPAMTIDCFADSGQPANLSGASSVKVKVWKLGALIWEREANKPANGVVVLPLQAADTDEPGTFRVKVLAVWPDGSKQHYPPGDSYMTMTVTR